MSAWRLRRTNRQALAVMGMLLLVALGTLMFAH